MDVVGFILTGFMLVLFGMIIGDAIGTDFEKRRWQKKMLQRTFGTDEIKVKAPK